MVFNIHAGHNPQGKKGSGAYGFISESTEARLVKSALINMLTELGHTCYDCTVDDGINANNVLAGIVKKSNQHTTDLDVSIHFNAGGGNGVEAYYYNGTTSNAKTIASTIVTAISNCGFKNRGVKPSNLYVLRKTKNPAILIEVCFVDNDSDVDLYHSCGPEGIARAICIALVGEYPTTESAETIDISDSDTAEQSKESEDFYRVCVIGEQKGAFHSKVNAEKLVEELAAKNIKAVII